MVMKRFGDPNNPKLKTFEESMKYHKGNDTGVKYKLRNVAVCLLINQVSSSQGDYPRKFPHWVLRDIERQNERQRLIACELVDIAETL